MFSFLSAILLFSFETEFLYGMSSLFEVEMSDYNVF